MKEVGVYLNIGNDNFKSAVQSQIYVDKTELLEYTNSVLDSSQRYICVSRPRRFGKSITADMLSAYYGKDGNSKELFAPLKIAQSSTFDEHLNKYQITVHEDFQIPSWYKEGVMYNIFVDRFNNGNRNGKVDGVKKNTFLYGNWDDEPMYIKEQNGE